VWVSESATCSNTFFGPQSVPPGRNVLVTTGIFGNYAETKITVWNRPQDYPGKEADSG
jgi:hypothetical protein